MKKRKPRSTSPHRRLPKGAHFPPPSGCHAFWTAANWYDHWWFSGGYLDSTSPDYQSRKANTDTALDEICGEGTAEILSILPIPKENA